LLHKEEYRFRLTHGLFYDLAACFSPTGEQSVKGVQALRKARTAVEAYRPLENVSQASARPWAAVCEELPPKKAKVGCRNVLPRACS